MAKPDAGDTIIAGAILGLALLFLLGLVGIPFTLWLAEFLLIVAGILMVRGDLGANATVGWILIIAGPATFILPGFFPGLTMTLPLLVMLGLIGLGLTRLLRLW